MSIQQKNIIQYGDFQTPLALAKEVLGAVCPLVSSVKTIIEPTCGTGTFLQAFLESKYTGGVEHVLGLEINPDYVAIAREKMAHCNPQSKQIEIIEQDFFKTDWEKILKNLPKPILFVGNPPWVTNSQLGRIDGANVPLKTNVKRVSGLDAMTGCSNFDISEWMLTKLLDLVTDTDSAIAFLVKTSVARKVFEYAFTRGIVAHTQIRCIDAKAHFDVNVDASLFVMCHVKSNPYAKVSGDYECSVYESLHSTRPTRYIGIINGNLVSDTQSYKKWQSLDASSPFKWRSGVKHDCSKVMVLTRQQNGFLNGFGEMVQITEEYVYPLLKSSDVAHGTILTDKCVIIPQKYIGEATESIAKNSPTTWRYLNSYAGMFQERKSSIYRNAPPFAVFGVGDYSFKNWKVAVSGLYKNFQFSLVPPQNGKPVMLDDTCYFLGFDTEEEAVLICELLASEPVSEFLEATVFKDDKRPVTASVLNRIDLQAVAKLQNKQYQFEQTMRIHSDKQNCFELTFE